MKILIASGGTGGHIFPAISLAQELRRRGYSDILFVSDDRIKERVKEAGFNFLVIDVPKMPYGISLKWFSFIIKFIASYSKAKNIIKRAAPDIAVGFGAYTSGCLIFAARAFDIKTMVHEQNVCLGRANKFLINKVDKACFSFDNSLLGTDKRFTLTGNPVREEILTDLKTLNKQEALSELGLSLEKKTLLVLGGSSGSKAINNLMIEFVKTLTSLEKAKLQIIHITGNDDLEAVSAVYKNNNINYWTKNFYDRMGLLYKACDIVICRCGAATIAEIALFGIPAIFIPYPWAGSHQRENAKFIARENKAILMDEKRINNEDFKKEIFELFNNQEKVENMSASIRSFASPQAAKNLADIVEELINVS